MFLDYFENCGIPNEYAAYSSAPTLNDNVVYSGHVVSRSGWCRYVYFPVPPAKWLGFSIRSMRLECADKMWIHSHASIFVINRDGQRCTGSPQALTFKYRIPSDWGGTLHVHFRLGIVAGMLDGGTRLNGRVETQTATFQLDGTADPCGTLTPVRD